MWDDDVTEVDQETQVIDVPPVDQDPPRRTRRFTRTYTFPPKRIVLTVGGE